MSALIYTIDDDVDFNMVLKMALSCCDIEVITHTKAEDFTRSVRDRTPSLCILDLNLDVNAGGEGFHLLRAIRNVLGPELPVLVMSKRGDKDDVKKAMELGANDFVPKPLDDHYLLQKIKHFLPKNAKLKELTPLQSSVSESEQEATLDISFVIKKVSLQGLELIGMVQLPKDIIIEIKSNSLKDIYGTSTLNFKTIECTALASGFGTRVEPELVTDQYINLRNWLVHGG